MQYAFLPATDPAVAAIIAREEARQTAELELIASENYTSPSVLEAMSSVLQNKYSEGYPGHRYYGGNHVIDEIESLAIARAKQLFGCQFANVQALSGSPANLAVYFALLQPGDTVLGLRLDCGGHLSHGHPVNATGKLFNFVQYGVTPDGRIDVAEVRRLAAEHKPKMIVAGFSAYSREFPWADFKEIADSVGAYTFADIAHIAGLVAAGVAGNPFDHGFDVVTTTTHKSLRGPRGALILSNSEEVAKKIDRAVFPGLQGGPHEHVIAAIAVALGEALRPEFRAYSAEVVQNAQTLAESLIGKGFDIVSGGTDNHLMVVDLRSKNLTGKAFTDALDAIGISVSQSTVPYDPAPPMKPNGIRLGTPAITTRGLRAGEMEMLADIINRLAVAPEDSTNVATLKAEVAALAARFPVPGIG